MPRRSMRLRSGGWKRAEGERGRGGRGGELAKGAEGARGRGGEGEILEERSMRSDKKMNKYDYR
jgi:hypothetical protein